MLAYTFFLLLPWLLIQTEHIANRKVIYWCVTRDIIIKSVLEISIAWLSMRAKCKSFVTHRNQERFFFLLFYPRDTNRSKPNKINVPFQRGYCFHWILRHIDDAHDSHFFHYGSLPHTHLFQSSSGIFFRTVKFYNDQPINTFFF